MAQQALWHDTVYDALRADIDAAGGSKVVAHKLWPAVDVTTAANKLTNAINPNQSQKLDPDEVLAIKRMARDVGSQATIDFEASQFGFKIEWLDPQDELSSLMRENSDDFKRIEARQKRLERLLERQGGK